MTSPDNQVLMGTVKNLTFRNEETGYFVARVMVRGEERTVTGYTPIIHAGEHLEAKGKFVSSKWGPQFKADSVQTSAPKDMAGIEKYLSSGAIDGIGKVYAKKLVAAFGARVFDVIEQEPHLLNDVPGIGKKKASSIVSCIKEAVSVRQLKVFLLQHGMTESAINRVYKKYGEEATEKLKKNPYLLCRDIWGIGFAKADAFARSTGITADSEFRIRAGLQHVVRLAVQQGSCGVPHDTLVEKASQGLNLEIQYILPQLQKEVEEQQLVKDVAAGETCYFPPFIYHAERSIAGALIAKARATAADIAPIGNAEAALLHAEMEIGLTLEETQKKAVLAALANPLCVITGGPGTGKTTITRTIIEILEAENLMVQIATPTGKSARRASAATGREAKTVHRVLEIGRDGKFKRNEGNPLDCDVLVVDELSMVDVQLFYALMRAVPPHCRVLLVGDVDQLPSVGPGKVLADIIDSGVIPLVRLTEIFRQAKTSKIIMNAHKVNSGSAPDSGWPLGADFGFLDKYDDREKDRTDDALVELVADMWKKNYDPIVDVQVLTPMRKGPLGSIALNEKLRARLNSETAEKLQVGIHSFWIGDKVMQLRNNYEKEVFNGDIGLVESVNHKDKTMVVRFEDRTATYKFNELEELTLAYAITIHKSQGSEFPVVVMPIDTSHFMMLKRNLVYTGITRAKKLMVMLGSKKAAWMSVQNTQTEERYSRLREWLVAANEEVAAPAKAA